MHLPTDPRNARRLETLGQFVTDDGRRGFTGGFPYNRGLPGSEPSVHAQVTPKTRRLKATGRITTQDIPIGHDPESALGQWETAAATAAALARRVFGGQPTTASGQPAADVVFPQGYGLPGTEQSVPRMPASVTTVSPTIQAQIAPQISPTMVQQQDSPGAVVGSAPSMFMPGGQAAETGVTPYQHYGSPGSVGTTPSLSPLQPYTLSPDGRYIPIGSGPGQYSPVPEMLRAGREEPAMPRWLPLAIVGAVGVIALTAKRRPRRASGRGMVLS